MVLPTFKVNLSIQLLLVIVMVILFGHNLSSNTQSFLYALSLSLKALLVFVMPLIIMSGMFNYMLKQEGKKLFFIVSLFLLICTSNFISTLIAYLSAFCTLRGVVFPTAFLIEEQLLKPLWELHLPIWLPNNYALISGLLLGTFIPKYNRGYAVSINNILKYTVKYSLEKVFVPLLPLFVLGFMVKMQAEGQLIPCLKTYGPILLLMLTTCLGYIMLLYLVLSGGRISTFINYLKNVLPAGILGFTTMSSIAALPASLVAAQKNTTDENLTKALVPAVVNVHLVGDSICIPFMAIAILLASSIPFPSFATYLHFALYFVLAKFSVAAIPGGGIIVMVPILEQFLGFNSQMSALITTLYILFDPFFTATNVLGNGAIVVFVSKLFGLKAVKSTTITAKN